MGEGDKIGSRSAQKGIVSRLYQTKDLPYTKEGVTPDIIINPHSIPSRMTIGHIYETYISKKVMEDTFGDGIEFDATIFNDAGTKLQLLIEEEGEEITTFYNPRTGQPIEGKIFFGVCYYQQLKHHVRQKMFYRTVAGKNKLTRQPTEGKSEGGGLRLGTMEIDALFAHNAGAFLQQKMKDESDNIEFYYCSNCHYSFQSLDYDCVNCQSTEFIVKADTTNISNIIFLYLTACGVELQIN
jgi:DNA-directed RNA polymerase beta subunit